MLLGGYKRWDTEHMTRGLTKNPAGLVNDLVSLQQSAPYLPGREIGPDGQPHDPFGHLAEDEARKHRRAFRGTGGWVAPLQGAQFAGSPQADTQTDGGDTGAGDAGDGGGSV